ncbi:MAG: magnesium transporter [Chloroflexota bacterium]
MTFSTLEDVLAVVRQSLEQDDISAAVAALEALRPPDKADLFSELKDQHQSALLPVLAPDSSADILEEMDDENAARIVATLPTADIIRIMDQMEPDEAADVLGEMEPSYAKTVLAGLEDPDEIRPLLLHPEDSAGGLMTSEYLVLRRKMTASEALAAVRTWRPDVEDVFDVYVVDQFGHLCGEVSVRQLLMSDPVTPVSDLMDPEVISVNVGTDQEEVARLMARYDAVTMPVVDSSGTLLGVITVDDVIDVLEEETTEDFQRLGASQPLERPYLDTSVLTVVRKRIGWLLLLFLTETLTGSVLRHFEAELSAVVALSFFIPLLIGTGGNAGSQTTSTIIRAIAVEDLDKRGFLRPLFHEFSIGFILGIVMAVVAYGRALMWGTTQGVALTVSVSIFAIVVWANSMGSVLPLIANRLKIDPTVVSGPAMSTLVDATGLFIYFTIAGILLAL